MLTLAVSVNWSVPSRGVNGVRTPLPVMGAQLRLILSGQKPRSPQGRERQRIELGLSCWHGISHYDMALQKGAQSRLLAWRKRSLGQNVIDVPANAHVQQEEIFRLDRPVERAPVHLGVREFGLDLDLAVIHSPDLVCAQPFTLLELPANEERRHDEESKHHNWKPHQPEPGR